MYIKKGTFNKVQYDCMTKEKLLGFEGSQKNPDRIPLYLVNC